MSKPSDKTGPDRETLVRAKSLSKVRQADDREEIRLPGAHAPERVPHPDRAETRLIAAHAPEEVYRALRMLAARNGTTMAEEIYKALHRHFQAAGEAVPVLDTVLEDFRLYGRRRLRRG
jgi:hypothetical protein